MTLFDRHHPRPGPAKGPGEVPVAGDALEEAAPAVDTVSTGDLAEGGGDVHVGSSGAAESPQSPVPLAEVPTGGGPLGPLQGRRLSARGPREGLMLRLPHSAQRQLDHFARCVRDREHILHERHFADHLGLGRAVVALFAGPADAGKLLAARELAHSLGAAVVAVDLARLVASSQSWQAEIEAALQAAEGGGDIVYLDHAALLFQTHGTQRDPQAMRTAELIWGLIAGFAGAVILAVDQRPSLDPSDARRLQVIVDFPPPDVENTRQILADAFPEDVQPPSVEEMRAVLAQLRLPTGSIASIASGAAFQAVGRGGPLQAIGQRDLVAAIAREYQKRGKAVTEGEFGAKFYAWAAEDVL